MKLRPENSCKFCSKLFCCLECRIKHEIRVHFSSFCETVSCDLCNGHDRIVLKQQNTNTFIDHLFKFHLPLHCKNCSAVFDNKASLTTVHTCVASEKFESEKLMSAMAFCGDVKIQPIIEEDVEQENGEKGHEISVAAPENGSSARNGLSMNGSENADKTPPTTLVRQTSTPMTKMLHELKRHSYESMSASSIQMSSIENCSSENDISPPVPMAVSNPHVFKPPSRRMPVAATPYRQIMSRSIQRAFNSQGISRLRSVDATPPLDLRTSPVIRRTLSMEGNVRPRPVGVRNDAMVDLRTTPVIRRTRHEAKNLAKALDARPDSFFGTFIESEKNQISKVPPSASPPTSSSLCRSKSSNSLYETCRSFDASVTSSNQISDTPKSSEVAMRSSSFSNRPTTKTSAVNKSKWFTPSTENAENVRPTTRSSDWPVLHGKVEAESDGKDEVKAADSKGLLWSLFSSVMRFTSGGGETATNQFPSNDNNSLIKRCASFTGILPKKPPINLNDENPYKRRRTTTLSKVESYSQLGDDGNDSGKKVQRIYGRPPIDRMRQS